MVSIGGKGVLDAENPSLTAQVKGRHWPQFNLPISPHQTVQLGMFTTCSVFICITCHQCFVVVEALTTAKNRQKPKTMIFSEINFRFH